MEIQAKELFEIIGKLYVEKEVLNRNNEQLNQIIKEMSAQTQESKVITTVSED
jgi:hypothetical protein